MLTGNPLFDSPIPEEDERCRMVAVNGLLRTLVAGWNLPVCEEVRLSLLCVLCGRETILWRRLYESSQLTSNNVVMYLEMWFQHYIICFSI